jgi:hypothetical protein
MDALRAKLKEAILHIERNQKLIKSITSFPYIASLNLHWEDYSLSTSASNVLAI